MPPREETCGSSTNAQVDDLPDPDSCRRNFGARRFPLFRTRSCPPGRGAEIRPQHRSVQAVPAVGASLSRGSNGFSRSGSLSGSQCGWRAISTAAGAVRGPCGACPSDASIETGRSDISRSGLNYPVMRSVSQARKRAQHQPPAGPTRASSSAIRSRMTNFCGLPVTVMGMSCTNRMCRGILKCAIRPSQ